MAEQQQQLEAARLTVEFQLKQFDLEKQMAITKAELDVYENVEGDPEVTFPELIGQNAVTGSRTGQRRLQDIVAGRRLRMAGHIISIPPGRPANDAMSWTPRGSGRRRGRPTKTWRSTFKEDLVDQRVDWNSVRAVATNRSRTLAAHCPVKDRRI